MTTETLLGSKSSYLVLARTVLHTIRRPLTPREILTEAYKRGVVPTRLHGQTQHKTLQARLSEDILRQRDQSAFFRPEPGKFFLREFMEDEDIPLQFRKPIVARRRIRDLPKTKVLAFELKTIQSWVDINNLTIHDFESLIENHRYYYVNSIRERKSGDVLVWTFVVVSKGSLVLTYRQGQYREGRDSFLHKRCVGFYNLVTDNDITLFERDDHGVLSSGIRTIAMDLDLPVDVIINSDSMQYSSFMCTFAEKGADLLAVMKYECPNWYEPLNRRLSLNDLTWLDATHVPNNMDDFDPWSQAVLQRVRSNLTTNTDND